MSSRLGFYLLLLVPFCEIAKADLAPARTDCSHVVHECEQHSACDQLWRHYRRYCPLKHGRCIMESGQACYEAYEYLRKTPLPQCKCHDDPEHRGFECHKLYMEINYNDCVERLFDLRNAIKDHSFPHDLDNFKDNLWTFPTPKPTIFVTSNPYQQPNHERRMPPPLRLTADRETPEPSRPTPEEPDIRPAPLRKDERPSPPPEPDGAEPQRTPAPPRIAEPYYDLQGLLKKQELDRQKTLQQQREAELLRQQQERLLEEQRQQLQLERQKFEADRQNMLHNQKVAVQQQLEQEREKLRREQERALEDLKRRQSAVITELRSDFRKTEAEKREQEAEQRKLIEQQKAQLAKLEREHRFKIAQLEMERQRLAEDRKLLRTTSQPRIAPERPRTTAKSVTVSFAGFQNVQPTEPESESVFQQPGSRIEAGLEIDNDRSYETDVNGVAFRLDSDERRRRPTSTTTLPPVKRFWVPTTTLRPSIEPIIAQPISVEYVQNGIPTTTLRPNIEPIIAQPISVEYVQDKIEPNRPVPEPTAETAAQLRPETLPMSGVAGSRSGSKLERKSDPGPKTTTRQSVVRPKAEAYSGKTDFEISTDTESQPGVSEPESDTKPVANKAASRPETVATTTQLYRIPALPPKTPLPEEIGHGFTYHTSRPKNLHRTWDNVRRGKEGGGKVSDGVVQKGLETGSLGSGEETGANWSNKNRQNSNELRGENEKTSGGSSDVGGTDTGNQQSGKEIQTPGNEIIQQSENKNVGTGTGKQQSGAYGKMAGETDAGPPSTDRATGSSGRWKDTSKGQIPVIPRGPVQIFSGSNACLIEDKNHTRTIFVEEGELKMAQWDDELKVCGCVNKEHVCNSVTPEIFGDCNPDVTYGRRTRRWEVRPSRGYCGCFDGETVCQDFRLSNDSTFTPGFYLLLSYTLKQYDSIRGKLDARLGRNYPKKVVPEYLELLLSDTNRVLTRRSNASEGCEFRVNDSFTSEGNTVLSLHSLHDGKWRIDRTTYECYKAAYDISYRLKANQQKEVDHLSFSMIMSADVIDTFDFSHSPKLTPLFEIILLTAVFALLMPLA